MKVICWFTQMYALEICWAIMFSDSRTVCWITQASRASRASTHNPSRTHFTFFWNVLQSQLRLTIFNGIMALWILCISHGSFAAFTQLCCSLHNNPHIRCDSCWRVWYNVNDATHLQKVIMCKTSRFYIQKKRKDKRACYGTQKCYIVSVWRAFTLVAICTGFCMYIV